MKKIFLLLAVIAFSSFTWQQHNDVRKDDKTLLITQLKQTKEGVLKSLQKLSDAQLEYKPAADRWSIIECVEHITLVEKYFFDMEQGLVKQPANPDKRKDVKVTDEQILMKMEDRSQKAKAPDFAIPKHNYATDAEAIKAFTNQRDKLIDYVITTTDDLRNHVMDHPVMGTIDAYQLLLMDAGHTNRHTQQIEEIKASAGFSKY